MTRDIDQATARALEAVRSLGEQAKSATPIASRRRNVDRALLARLILAGLDVYQLAVALGCTVRRIQSVCYQHGAAPRYRGQAQGTWPAPTAGRLVDPTAPEAPVVLECPECGRRVTRWNVPAHLEACNPRVARAPASEVEEKRKPTRRRSTVGVAVLLVAGWSRRELADALDVSLERVEELEAGSPPRKGEKAALVELAGVAAPASKARGSAREQGLC